MSVQIRTLPIVANGLGGVITALPNNPNRVWLIVSRVNAATDVMLCLSKRGILNDTYYNARFGDPAEFLRRDLGPLVTSAQYISDGAGNAPVCTITITEGVLTPKVR